MRSLLAIVFLVFSAHGCGAGPTAGQSGGITLVIDLEDRGELSEGDPVTLRGFEVGRVTSLRLKRRVRAEVYVGRQAAQSISTCSYGMVTTDWMNRASIEIVVIDVDAPLIVDGATLPGATTIAEKIKVESKIRVARALEMARDGIGEDRLKWMEAEGKRVVEQGAGAAKQGYERAQEAGGSARDLLSRARDEVGELTGQTRELMGQGWKDSKRAVTDAASGRGVLVEEASRLADKAKAAAEQGLARARAGLEGVDLSGKLDEALEGGRALLEEGREALQGADGP